MDGTVVIAGEGEMPDFVEPDFPDGAPWDAYTGDISNATVAAGIESLSAAAFAKRPTGNDKKVFFEDPAHKINLAAFVSGDGSVTNDFTAEQILLPAADGGVTNAVKLLAEFDVDAPHYDSIAEAIASNEVSFVTAYTLDGLKEMAEIGLADEAGPQPWTERVAAAVTNAIAEIEAAVDAETVISKGGAGRIAIQNAKSEDSSDDSLHGNIPDSDLSWTLVGGQLVIEGEGKMPAALTPVPWDKSKGLIGTVVVGEGVTGLSKGLFTSELTAPAETVIFASKTASVPLDAFVDASRAVNDAVTVLFATKTDGVNEAPCGWTDANDKTKTYGSYAEAFEDGATAVKPVFAAASGTVEERIDKAPAAIVEKVQSYDEEKGKFTKDPNGELISVATVIENVNTNGAETVERIVASAVSGLNETARAEAEASGCTVVTLTVDAIPVDSSDLVQEKMTGVMPYGNDFKAKFAEITLSANDVPVTESPTLIEIHVPYVMEDRINFAVTRMHDGKVEMFTEIDDAADKADATFMVGDREIVLWTDKFSLYAIGSVLKEDDGLKKFRYEISDSTGIAGKGPYSISVKVFDPPGDLAVEYSADNGASWSSTLPLYNLEGDYTTLCRLTASGYTTVTKSATVKLINQSELGNGVTGKTPVPVAYKWLEDLGVVQQGSSPEMYEAAAMQQSGFACEIRGAKVGQYANWEAALLGLDSSCSNFVITVDTSLEPMVRVAWNPDKSEDNRVYQVYVCTDLATRNWQPIDRDDNGYVDVSGLPGSARFFKVSVSPDRTLNAILQSAKAVGFTGDINHDGVVNGADVELLRAHVVNDLYRKLGLSYNPACLLSGARLTAADINGDGTVDAVDLSLLTKKAQ